MTDDLELYGIAPLAPPPDAGHGAMPPSPAILANAAVGRRGRHRHGVAAPGERRGAHGPGLWGLVRSLGARILPNTARLPLRQGGGDHGSTCTRGVRPRPGSSWR